ncbi:unnamed protein product [Closterium sp. NIES-54]
MADLLVGLFPGRPTPSLGGLWVPGADRVGDGDVTDVHRPRTLITQCQVCRLLFYRAICCRFSVNYEAGVLCHRDASDTKFIVSINPVLASPAAEEVIRQPWVSDFNAAPYHPALPTPAVVPPVPVNPAAPTAAADPAPPDAPALDAPMVGAAPAGAVASQSVVSSTTDDPGQVAVSVAPAPPTASPVVPAPDFQAVPDPAPLAAVPPAQRQLSPGRRRPGLRHVAVAVAGGGGRGRGGGWAYDQPVTMADLQRVVSDAVRLERKGQASQSNSPRVAPAHASRPPSALDEPAPPLPQSAVPPPLAPSASAAARGNRMRLPWVPPVAGMEFVTAAGGQVTAQYPSLLPVAPTPPAVPVHVQSLVGPLPSVEVPEASLGQLWRLSEGLRAVHLIQVYGHAALSQGAHLDPGPRDECLDAGID